MVAAIVGAALRAGARTAHDITRRSVKAMRFRSIGRY
jgi:hypothetical protein